ncbi:MAG TPA: EAL domain-containing protein, partial [Marinagarivorans sp.]|nr:EAL domain-containing protein [Marinagarivorans sp.]
SQQRLELMGALGQAIQAQELVLYFQPKINLQDDQIYAFEALVRWQHPELGLIPPSEFIPLAEMSSLIYPLTRWVLENSISQCQAWRRMGYPLGVAVNLSVRNLMDERIVGDLRKMLVLYNLPADALELEITESMIMHDPERALDVLEQLADLGITLSIDDFGTGYSSLAYLKRLPVRTLKIDYSFVCGMLQDKQDQIIVHSTINLAHNLGLYVVAEGVESAEVWAELKQLGCDAAQGFYLGIPMPAPDSLAWLSQGSWQPPGAIAKAAASIE